MPGKWAIPLVSCLVIQDWPVRFNFYRNSVKDMSKEDAMTAYLKEMKESLEDAPYEHELTQQLYKICDK